MPQRLQTFGICLLLVVLTLAVYYPLLRPGYEFLKIDDDEYVTYNPHVRAGLSGTSVWWALTAFHSYNWHPLTWMSLQLDYQLHGLEPRGYHVTNVLLHAANAVLLFLALQKLTGAAWRCATVAAFFAVHPLHVESVAWIAERKDVLSTLFWMLTLWAYAHYAQRPRLTSYLLVVIAFLAGLMAKPMVVTLPFVLLLLDYWPLGRLRLSRERNEFRSTLGVVAEKLPLFALAAGACVLTVLAQRGAVRSLEQFPLSIRVLNALLSYVTYIGKMFWPHPLANFYPHPGVRLSVAHAVAAGLALACVTSLVLWQARRRPYLAVGWFWYLGTLVPVIGLVQVGLHAMADRYTYVPLIGIFIMLAWGISGLLGRTDWKSVLPKRGTDWKSVLPAGGALALLCGCVIVTRHQLTFWHTTLTVWRHSLDVTPENNPATHTGLGHVLLEQGAVDEAMSHFQEALKLEPDRAVSHLNVGLAFGMQDKMDEAERELRYAVQLDSEDAVAHSNLATLLARRGQVEEALRQFDESLRLKPDDAGTHYNLAGVLMRQGQVEAAEQHFATAAQLDPLLPDAQDSLGMSLERQGKFREAAACYRQAITLRPDKALYHCDLALALQQAGETDKADAEYRRALRIDRNWPFVANQTAWRLATSPAPQLRDGFMAVRLAQQCGYISGDSHPAPLDTLAAAYAEIGCFDRAVEVARRAAALAAAQGNDDLAKRIRDRIQLYERQQPFREPAATLPRQGEKERR